MYYTCLAVVLAYLVFCAILVPDYRYVALIVMALIVACATSAWRLLPSERLVVRIKAEALARHRCCPPSGVVHDGHCAARGVKTAGMAPHEPFTGDIRV